MKAIKNTISRACVIVPTYNESKNIEYLLDLLFYYERHQKSKKKFSLQVLVVDDSSPDGTALIVQKYKARNSAVHLLLRKGKEGLGKAYIAGMQHRTTPTILREDGDNGARVDYIFCTPDIKILEAGIHTADPASDASDHFPVFATIEI